VHNLISSIRTHLKDKRWALSTMFQGVKQSYRLFHFFIAVCYHCRLLSMMFFYSLMKPNYLKYFYSFDD
jgi:hypothetical protein